VRPYQIIHPLLGQGLVVHQATAEDTPQVMALLVKTAQWLKSQGSTQWSAILEGQDVHGTGDAVKRGDVFLFKQDEVIAAMVILLTEPSAWDIDLWGDEGHEESFYVHRLAIDRDYAGQGIGRAVMDWVEHGIRIEGKSRIRLDCIESNDTLYRFYSSAGFTHKARSKGFHLFEKASAAPSL